MKLPLDCDAEYIANYVSSKESAAIFDWVHQNLDINQSERILMADGSYSEGIQWSWRLVDPELMDPAVFHEFHGRRRELPDVLKPLRDRLEKTTGIELNVCVCLYYKNGEEGMALHSDPPAFGPTDIIPSISLGQPRAFLIQKKSDPSDTYQLTLEDGSLFIMGKGCQDRYEHGLPTNPEYQAPRINLTFRPFSWPEGLKRGSCSL